MRYKDEFERYRHKCVSNVVDNYRTTVNLREPKKQKKEKSKDIH